MKILYIYAHPNPDSFNSALKDDALSVFKHLDVEVKVSDLYALGFKATADWDDFVANDTNTHSQYFLAQQDAYLHQHLANQISDELAKISWADHIIFQFPLWWFSTPAILKGWLDRVLVKGFAYDTGKVFSQGLLKGKTASLVVTTQSPASAYQKDGLHQATIDTFLHPMHHTLRFVGIETLAPCVIYAAFNLETSRKEMITQDYRAYLEDLVQKYQRMN